MHTQAPIVLFKAAKIIQISAIGTQDGVTPQIKLHHDKKFL